jgi:N-acylneuraminate cytidylyltransferase
MLTHNNQQLSVVAFIFARGGSKGVPGKNIRLLAGKPLIAYAIETAQQSKYVDKVIVSTDSEDIAQVAKTYGAEVPFMRPEELAKDASPEWLAWQHALEYLENNEQLPDIFLSVPATSPMRLAQDLDECVEKLVKEGFDLVITASEAQRSPYFNMIRLTEQGEAQLALKPETPITRRQDAPQFYDVATVAYAAESRFIQRNTGLFDGKVGCVILPTERTLDIDTEFDFKLAEVLLNEKTTK